MAIQVDGASTAIGAILRKVGMPDIPVGHLMAVLRGVAGRKARPDRNTPFVAQRNSVCCATKPNVLRNGVAGERDKFTIYTP